ncbi:hypothetical protein E2C01_080527 [Portunus trituberculatus]|uniref:Uncharacterized protein n=1 Tax=Portunus trituberculatus TaxID=210409 RepID=A0A5B7IUB1_PORTR|nr:hypothetical protein [Portunus trituberculatus]
MANKEDFIIFTTSEGCANLYGTVVVEGGEPCQHLRGGVCLQEELGAPRGSKTQDISPFGVVSSDLHLGTTEGYLFLNSQGRLWGEETTINILYKEIQMRSNQENTC